VLLAGVLLRVLLELLRRAVVERDVAVRFAEASDRARRDLAVRVVLLEVVERDDRRADRLAVLEADAGVVEHLVVVGRLRVAVVDVEVALTASDVLREVAALLRVLLELLALLAQRLRLEL